MCGIAGIVNFRKEDIHLPSALQSMCDTLSHRGPDGEGFLFVEDSTLHLAGGKDTPEEIFQSTLPYAPNKSSEDVPANVKIGLGHRRLSIIDLSPAGHQPMCSQDKDYWIVHNGEVYNYLELKAKLQTKGHEFHTQTDTEVILKAYQEWGADCVEHFNGMWSFVIYDKAKNKLFGARDRFGVKPFYYYFDGDVFAFASEQKALINQLFVQTKINDAAVFDFFIKGEIEYEEEGFFKNIHELFPSQYFFLDLQTGDFQKKEYYQLSVNEQNVQFDQGKAVILAQELREKFLRAVQLRLRADVTVGSCLSGGIDSSAIVGGIDELLNSQGQLKVFTAAFEDANIDESKWAGMMAEHINAEWHQTFPKREELWRDLDELIYSQDVPIWSTSTYAQHRVMKLIQERGIKVVLDGQGGDELFAGYPTYHMDYWLELLKKAKLNTLLGEMKPAEKAISFFFRQYMRFYGIQKLPKSSHLKVLRSYFKDIEYLNPDFVAAYRDRIANKEFKHSSLNDTLSREFVNTRLKGYLKCEDRCAMWHSVESRTPFADDLDLIEFGFKLPSAYKIHQHQSKYLLRQAIQSLVPDAIMQRSDKMGYNTPNNQWISDSKEDFKAFFTDDLKPYIQVEKLQQDFNNFFEISSLPENGRIFKFISFSKWKSLFYI